VSRCFIQPEGVGDETRNRIFEVARQLGYRPNSAARSIRCGRSRCVVLLRDAQMPHHYLHTDLLGSIHQRLGDCHLGLKLESLSTDGGMNDVFRQTASDGVLILSHGALSGEAERYTQDLSIPVVWVNTLATADCVCPDDLRAGKEATDLLIGMGHRRIAFLDQPRTQKWVQVRYCNAGARLEGYRQAMIAAGLDPLVLRVPATACDDEPMSACRQILNTPRRPTGLVTCRKEDAQIIVYAAYACHGMQIPRDLSIVTFSDEPPGTAPRLTAWVVPWPALGLAAVDMLVHKIEHAEPNVPPHLLPMQLHAGETVAGPPRATN
jgi:LacI family transcriptional regulator